MAAVTVPRLVGVEIRKSVDTRSGFWLMAAVVAITAVTVVVSAFQADAGDAAFHDVLTNAIQPAAIFLPIIGILLVASEWGQRTALQTFTLVPNRLRVLGAKLGAALVLAIGSYVVAVVLSAVAVAAVSPGGSEVWTLPVEVLAQDLLYVVAWVCIGVAFGAALLMTAPAIVLYFALPTAIMALASLKPLEDVGAWVDPNDAMNPLYDGTLNGTEWGRIGTSLALWLLLPALIGMRRVKRAEIS